MILIDLSQVVISGITFSVSQTKIQDPNEDLILHFALDSIRKVVKKFKHEYGDVVICCDNKKYWRKAEFPHYKASRKKSREKSNLDWQLIFKVINQLKVDIKEYFPYKIVDVEGAEADDVIATLTKVYHKREKIIICSSDGDFKQLQKYENVKQYNPTTGIFIKSPNVEKELKEKIIRGDAGDGLSNILSIDECFIIGKRQTPISSKKLEVWLTQSPEEFCTEEMLIRYNRNKKLIDFEGIPTNISDNIISEYNTVEKGARNKTYKYLIEKNMINLLEVIGDF